MHNWPLRQLLRRRLLRLQAQVLSFCLGLAQWLLMPCCTALTHFYVFLVVLAIVMIVLVVWLIEAVNIFVRVVRQTNFSLLRVLTAPLVAPSRIFLLQIRKVLIFLLTTSQVGSVVVVAALIDWTLILAWLESLPALPNSTDATDRVVVWLSSSYSIWVSIALVWPTLEMLKCWADVWLYFL